MTDTTPVACIFPAAALRALAPINDEAALFREAGGACWVMAQHKDHGAPGVAESHDHEVDYYYVLEGEADLYLGGTLVNPYLLRAGQHRGDALDGATHHRMIPGDLIIIPAGTPHQVDATRDRIIYLVFKQRTGG